MGLPRILAAAAATTPHALERKVTQETLTPCNTRHAGPKCVMHGAAWDTVGERRPCSRGTYAPYEQNLNHRFGQFPKDST